MKTTKIAVAAMTVLCAVSLVSSCVKAGKEKEPAAQPETEFTVSLNTVEADYAEVVVRHTGAKDVTWFGFVTDDVTSSEQDLINAQVAHLDKKSLHVGNAQTVAVRNLSETSNYRYIAFAVKDGKEVFGKPGSVSFSTSPNLKVTFSAEATEVKCNEASFTIGHAGYEALTYTCFVTTDSATSAAQLAQSDFSSNVTEGKLNEGVVLLSGNSQTVTFDELDDETNYRLIVYGIFDNNGTYIYYGTPADCAFSTPIDLSTVTFTAKATDVTNTSANIVVGYSASANNLTWYGFLTEDQTSEASALISAKIAGIGESDWQAGPKTVSLTDLTKDTEYRYIVTGINADGVYGVAAEVKFTAYMYEAAYNEYIGTWTMTGADNVYDFTIEKKVEGQSYTISGLSGATVARYGIDTPLVVEATYANGVLSIACQTISASYVDPLDEATYVDMFCGMYQYNSQNIVDVNEGSVVAKFIMSEDGTIEVAPGVSSDGDEYIGMRFFQVAVSGDDIYSQDTKGTSLPNVATPAAAASEAYNAWLGTWYIPTVVYQYDSNDEYIGEEVKPLPIEIKKDIVNKSYLISGIGPNNDKYDVPAEFVDGKLVAHPQVVYTWTHSQAGEIKELFAGLYGEGEDAMWTWDPSLTLFTATIGSGGKATLTPGQSSDGIAFNGFQFIQYYSGGAYGYGGEYTLPNTMSRTQTASSVPASFHAGKLCAKTASPVKMQKGAVKFFVK